MAWTTFQLGNTGNLTNFATQPADINFSPDPLETTVRNRAGELLSTFRQRISERITVRYPFIDTDEVNMLNSMLNDGSEFKELRVQDAFKIIDEVRVSSDASTIKVMRSSRIGIAIEGVWLATDTGHSGTNFYTGGSFSQSTFTISLGTPFNSGHSGYPNVEAIVNYTFVGWKVRVLPPRFVSLRNSRLYTANLAFEGV